MGACGKPFGVSLTLKSLSPHLDIKVILALVGKNTSVQWSQWVTERMWLHSEGTGMLPDLENDVLWM